MAEIDYGVITVKNGRLMKNTPDRKITDRNIVYQGSSGELKLDKLNLNFWKYYVTELTNTNEADKIPDFMEKANGYYWSDKKEDFVTGKKHRAIYWKYRNVQFKTKILTYYQNDEKDVEYIFWTKFRYNGDWYNVIQGYDVSLNYFHSRNAGKIVQKLVLNLAGKKIKIKSGKRHRRKSNWKKLLKK